MSTQIDSFNPVVGINKTEQNINFNATDWLEIKNDSPFGITVNVLGVSSNSFFLSPFEHNGWPIQQLLQSAQLQVKALSIQIVPSHYYTNVATENNSPCNICTVSVLSAQEASTNTYPLYTSRMNTTVATIANTLNNTGNAPATPIVFAEPNGDNSPNGAVNINNQGQMTLGDSLYNAALTLLGIDSAQLAMTRNQIQLLNSVGTLVLNILAATGIELANSFPIGVIDSTATFRKTLYADNLDEIILAASKANNILFEDNTGVTLATIDGNGIHLNSGTFNLKAGTLSRFVYTHIASVTTIATFFNHNLGVVPDFCILIPNDGVLSTGNFNAYYESSSMTSTQVKLQSNSAGGIPVGLIAIKL